jgi:DNA-binding protein Alba
MSAPTVLIGKKPLSRYVLACLFALQQNGSVEVKARGRAIPKVIGAVQVLREGLVRGLEVESVDIGTERLQGKDGREVKVSTISIRVSLPEKKPTEVVREARDLAQFGVNVDVARAEEVLAELLRIKMGMGRKRAEAREREAAQEG